AQHQGDFVAVVQLEDHALQVQQDVDDIFAHARDGRVFVHHAGHLHFGGRIARHRGQQDAAQGIAQRVAVAALERLHHDLGVVGADRFDFNGTRLQKTLSGHLQYSFSIPSARYTDKADGNKKKARQECRSILTAKPAPRKCGKRAAAGLAIGCAAQAGAPRGRLQRLTRVQFDDHRFVDGASDISAVGNRLEGTRHLVAVDFHPLGDADAGGQVERFADTALLLGLFAHGDHVARLHDHRGDVGGVAVQLDGAVGDQLASLGARRAEAHAVHDVVQARFEQLDQRFAGVAAATLGLGEVLAELLFQHAVHALELLLFTQLQAVVGGAG